MDKGLFKILKKVYFKKAYIKDENGYMQRIDNGDKFDSESGTTHYSYDGLSSAEILTIEQSGYPVNEIVKYSHDECISAYKTLLEHPHLSIENVLSAYICGFSSFPRGRQPILSYLFAQAVPQHTMHAEGDVCPVCSIRRNVWIEKGYKIFSCYAGNVWNERWCGNLVELAEFMTIPPCTPTPEDISIFKALIEMIRHAPQDETPGKLEQRIKKAKIIPHYEKYHVRGQLMVLAELGVMPNPYVKPLYDDFTHFADICSVKYPGSTRSDIILPLAGWRGEKSINETRLQALFGNIIR
ncbi:hypothetical protein [Shewanella putrefaciens]|uniref:hypothetical protein n=1 Tax=Shewanella putrefaciens TaxID=24 RepID=UPI001353DECF|nr:hypothetical protein [Shewanella putrefaciens]MCA1896097.1 hypothetical protein [Shewanella putrefaciens]CAD6366883.1 hypothetical protein SHEWT2_01340 [Shewanella hafniensis]